MIEECVVVVSNVILIFGMSGQKCDYDKIDCS